MAEKRKEEILEIVEVQKTPVWLAAIAVLAIIASGITLAWVYELQSHVSASEANLVTATEQNVALTQKLDETNARLKAQGEALGQKVGMSQKQLEERSDQLIAEEKSASVTTTKLAKQQMATDQKVVAVQQDVAAVKTDVTAVKTDVASTQAEMIATKKQVAKVASDQTVLGTDIATNRQELRELKAKGDRTYYEFAIEKGAPAINLATIKLSTKMVDEKHSKFTLIIGSDDKNIEKVNQSLNQSIQFYSGKTPQLYEVVVNGISKRMISGYLSVPKDAPKAMMP